MKTTRTFSIAIIAALLCGAFSYPAQAQNPFKETRSTGNKTESSGEMLFTNLLAQARTNRRAGFSLMPSKSPDASGSSFAITAAAAPNLTVIGSGTVGRLTKWTGFTSSNSVIGNSTIFENKDGLVGIGTDSPTSRLTVVGTIAATDGFKFPAGAHDATLKGDGTVSSPLGVAIPLNLTGTSNFPILSVTNTAGSFGVRGTAHNGVGVIGNSNNLIGIAGTSVIGTGVEGSSTSGIGITGNSFGGIGIFGTSFSSDGMRGTSEEGNGIRGASNSAVPTNAGVRGKCISCIGVLGESTNGTGVSGLGPTGVFGESPSGTGVFGKSTDGFGVFGKSTNANGLNADSENGDGLQSNTDSTSPTKAAIVALSSAIVGGAIAGNFHGTVRIENLTQPGDLIVAGKLQVTSGMKMFHIDHPLDPENKYLNHAAIESSEVLNVYSGNVITNADGEAVVTLPDWFEALNSDFRYQLTVLGTFAQAIVADEIKNNRFAIKTNTANVKVSWQVTGVRSDPTARKFKFDIEEEKSKDERGYYLNPDAFNQPEEKSIQWARDPEGMQQLRQRRIEAEQMRKPAKPNQR
jgi:hypothetical protein